VSRRRRAATVARRLPWAVRVTWRFWRLSRTHDSLSAMVLAVAENRAPDRAAR
jgi:hypothetical protein